jgi:hypothetical protein
LRAYFERACYRFIQKRGSIGSIIVVCAKKLEVRAKKVFSATENLKIKNLKPCLHAHLQTAHHRSAFHFGTEASIPSKEKKNIYKKIKNK